MSWVLYTTPVSSHPAPGRALAKLIAMSSSPPTILRMAATSNTSNPDLHSSLFPLPLPSSVLDLPSFQSPSRADSEPLADSDSTGSANASALPDVDPQIIEALKSKDRIYVLKLGEQMESLINDRRFVFFPPLLTLRLSHRGTSHLAFPFPSYNPGDL